MRPRTIEFHVTVDLDPDLDPNLEGDLGEEMIEILADSLNYYGTVSIDLV